MEVDLTLNEYKLSLEDYLTIILMGRNMKTWYSEYDLI